MHSAVARWQTRESPRSVEVVRSAPYRETLARATGLSAEKGRPGNDFEHLAFIAEFTASLNSQGGLPDENFALVRDGQIAGVVAIGAFRAGRQVDAELLAGDWRAGGRRWGSCRRQWANVGIICSGLREMIVPRFIQAPVRISAPLSRTIVPPFICRPVKSLAGPPNHDRAAPHPHADFQAGRAIDDDRAVLHAAQRAAVGRADLAAGVAVDVDEAVLHLGADPVAGVAVDFDPAAGHVGAQVHADRAVDGDAPLRHRPADPADLVQRAVQNEVGAALAFDVEELAQRQLPLAVIDRQRANLGVRQTRHDVGRQDFGFQRNRRVGV